MSPTRLSADEQANIHRIMGQVRDLLQELQTISTRFSTLSGSQPRRWDRIRYPRAETLTLRLELHYQTSTLNLFLTGTSTATLARIESLVRDIATN